MRVTCRQCKKVYEIPDERLPHGKKVAFPCRSCETLVEIDLRPKEAPPASVKENTPPPAAKKAATVKEKKRLAGVSLKKVILGGATKLPAIPQAVLEALKTIRRPDATFEEISTVLSLDQAITVDVLKLANSAHYGQAGRITSVHKASIVLGLKTLVELIVIVGTSEMLRKKLKGYNIPASYTWKHALATGFAAKILAERKGDENAHDAFTAGLIHDVGKIVLDPYVFERKADFDDYFASRQRMFYHGEKRLLGFDHAEIAFDLCRTWNIPQEIRDGVKYHHEPSKVKRRMAYIVHAANIIAKRTSIEPENDDAVMEADQAAFEFLNINAEDILYIAEAVENAVMSILI